MIVLGIETSCDETAAAVVPDGGPPLAGVVASQVALHGPYGGVVPEIACRAHVERLPGVAGEALRRAGLGWEQLDAVAVTYGPGLAGSLLVGLAWSKALAFRLGRPLYGINHLHAHVYAAFLDDGPAAFEAACPLVALVVSGGHTCLVRVERSLRCRLLGQTVDDAAGEAFDKAANLLDLGYPGGPAIDRAARGGRRDAVAFPRGRQRPGKNSCFGLPAELCFSFSGLKTALLYYLKQHPLSADRREVPDLAASFQEAVVDALVERVDRAMAGERCLVVGGGVSLNGRLRERLQALAAERRFRLRLSPPAYCADNAAMIAGLAGCGYGVRGRAALALDVEPSLEIAPAPRR